tara:strand:- start:62 stop:493 length:432 start_codon:yes stop_codon:yes gene_type:complete
MLKYISILAIFIIYSCYSAGTHGKIVSFELNSGKAEIEKKLLGLNSDKIKVKNLPNYGNIERPGYMSYENQNYRPGVDVKYTLHFYGGQEYYDQHPNNCILSIIYIDEINGKNLHGLVDLDEDDLIEHFQETVIEKLTNKPKE